MKGFGMPSQVGMAAWNQYKTKAELDAYLARVAQTARIGSDNETTSADDRANAIAQMYGVISTDPSAKPFSIPACPVNCRDPGLLKDLQGRLNVAASTRNESVVFRKVLQSFANGTRCEYKMSKDVTTIDPYSKRSTTESDLETYVLADFVQLPGAAGASTTSCTGVKHVLASAGPEVYSVATDAVQHVPRVEAEGICRALGGTVATYAQLQDAFSKGAHWCKPGWVSDTDKPLAYFPMQEAAAPCGNGVGVMAMNIQRAHVNCFGVKPESGKDGRIMPFGRAAGAWSSSAQLQALVEFPPDLDAEVDATGNEVYRVRGKQVTPPFLLSYDPATGGVSSRVNATELAL